MKLNLSKTLSLLSVLLLSSVVVSAAPSSNRSNCCTPINKDSIIAALHPVHASGGVSANYTLRFNPSNQFKNQMQAYINYLHAMNPSITSIITHWRIGDVGAGTLPATPGNGGVVAGAGQQFTAWNSGGNGNLSNGPGNFWNGYPLKVNHWYHIYTGTYLNDGNEFFSKKCAYNDFYVNFQVLKSSNGNGQLQISDGTRIIKTIPFKNGKNIKVMDKINTRMKTSK